MFTDLWPCESLDRFATTRWPGCDLDDSLTGYMCPAMIHGRQAVDSDNLATLRDSIVWLIRMFAAQLPQSYIRVSDRRGCHCEPPDVVTSSLSMVYVSSRKETLTMWWVGREEKR